MDDILGVYLSGSSGEGVGCGQDWEFGFSIPREAVLRSGVKSIDREPRRESAALGLGMRPGTGYNHTLLYIPVFQ